MTDSQPPTVVPEDITESVAISSIKSIAEQPAMLANLALANLINNINLSQQNAVAQQQALNHIQASVLGKVVNMLTTLGPLEAMSAQQLLTGNSVAEELADLKAVAASFPTQTTRETDQKQAS